MTEEKDVVARSQLKRLRGSGISLDKDAIIDNYVDVEFKEYLDGLPSSEDKKKAKKKLVDYYKNGEGKNFMDEQMSKLKDLVKKASEGVSELSTSAAKTVALNSVPAVITTGSATSAPNPAYSVIDNAQKKEALKALLKTVNGYVVAILEIAILIHWVIPSSVLNLIELLATVTGVINAIPG